MSPIPLTSTHTHISKSLTSNRTYSIQISDPSNYTFIKTINGIRPTYGYLLYTLQGNLTIGRDGPTGYVGQLSVLAQQDLNSDTWTFHANDQNGSCLASAPISGTSPASTTISMVGTFVFKCDTYIEGAEKWSEDSLYSLENFVLLLISQCKTSNATLNDFFTNALDAEIIVTTSTTTSTVCTQECPCYIGCSSVENTSCCGWETETDTSTNVKVSVLGFTKTIENQAVLNTLIDVSTFIGTS